MSPRSILFILGLVIISCNKQHSNADLSIFKYNEPAGIHTLDPTFAKDQATIWATNQLFNGLVQLDDSLNLKPSISNAGMDPNNLPSADKSSMNFGSGGNTKSKAWKDIWGSGQGIGRIYDSPPVSELVDRIKAEYEQAKEELNSK